VQPETQHAIRPVVLVCNTGKHLPHRFTHGDIPVSGLHLACIWPVSGLHLAIDTTRLLDHVFSWA
jgi:hypothetical protein